MSQIEKLAPLFVVFAAILWGIDGIILRPELLHLSVSLVVLIESCIVTLYLTPVFRQQLTQVKTFRRNDWFAFVGVAVFGGAVGAMAITKAFFYVGHINLAIVVLMQKLQPVLALTLAALFLKERLPADFFIWAAMAMAGAYVMTFGLDIPHVNAGNKTSLAAFFAFVAAGGFAASTVLSKRALKNVSFELGTYLRFLISTVLMLALVSGFGDLSAIRQVTRHQALIFLLIAFTTGGPAIFLYYFGLKKITASVAAICELAFPLSAILFEYLIRGNLLAPVQWVGASALLFSIVKVSKIESEKLTR